MPTDNTHSPVWFSVGEPSGDLHGAELMKHLRERDPALHFTGMGGPAMRGQGLEQRYDMGLISLVGITEILGGLPRILLLLRRIRLALMAVRPRAVILIDCPEFNFRVAKMAGELGIPVYYYISPQLWAWRPKRVEFLREHVRKVICILPFEKEFYARHNMEVDYVGHPLMDVLPLDRLDAMPVDDTLIGLLPGSRSREVATLLPEFAAAARLLHAKRPELRFVIVRAPGMDRERLLSLWDSDIPVEIAEPENRYEVFRACKLMLAASGTVTLETALIGTPVVVAYQVSAVSALVARLLVRVDYISLPNLIAGSELYPELIQDRARAVPMAEAASRWLDDPAACAETRQRLAGLRAMVGEPGAADRAAGIILDDLASLDS
jgi:lipid-A-disaccharide synthase